VRGGSVRVLLTALLGATLGWAAAPRGDLVVVRGGATLSVPVERQRGYPAARASALAQALGYAWTGGALDLDGERVRFISGSPFFTAGTDVFQLPNPVYRSGSHLMVPVSWALDWLPQRRPRRWRYLDGRLVAWTGDWWSAPARRHSRPSVTRGWC